MKFSLKNNYFKVLLSFFLILIFGIYVYIVNDYDWDEASIATFGFIVFTIGLVIIFWVLLSIIGIKSGFASRFLISSILIFSLLIASGLAEKKNRKSAPLTLCDCLKSKASTPSSKCKTKFRSIYGTSDPSANQMKNDYYNCK